MLENRQARGDSASGEWGSTGVSTGGSNGRTATERRRAGMMRLLGVAAVLCIAGCGGSSPANTGTSTPPATPAGPTPNSGAAVRIYVVQQSGSLAGSILQFPATASGSVSPASTITPNTPVAQVATDAYGNIYFFNGSNIVEYAAGSSGAPTPTRQIMAGSASRICCLAGLGVSPGGTILLGQDNGEIDEWSATANGAVAPTRYILGASQTGGGASLVTVANQVTADASDNIYVATAGAPGVAEVEVFGPSASANAAPSRSVGPYGLAGGLAVDSTGNIYVTSSICNVSVPAPTCTGTISVYPTGTASTTTPSRVITGSATRLGLLGQIKVDSVGNLYVVSTSATGTNPTVLVFSATSLGNAAPTSSFTSPAWTSPDVNPSIAIY